MSELYLILHKVRGERAWDVAIKLELEEEIWIIPTSGHRAYPLCMISFRDIDLFPFENVSVPSDWPDHYQVSESREQRVRPGAVNSLLAALGHVPAPIKRRKLSA